MVDLIEILSEGAILPFDGDLVIHKRHMELKIELHLAWCRPSDYDGEHILHCRNALDYMIRPTDFNLIEGRDRLKLEKRSIEELQSEYGGMLNTTYKPGGDGEVFDPPLKLKAVRLGDTLILAERFLLRPLRRR